MVSSGVTGRVWVGGEGLRSKNGVALGLAGGIVGRSVSILATGAKLSSFGDTWFADIHSKSFRARLRQTVDDLAHTATDIQHSPTEFIRFQRVGIFRIKILVPTGEKFCVSFIVCVRILMIHVFEIERTFS